MKNNMSKKEVNMNKKINFNFGSIFFIVILVILFSALVYSASFIFNYGSFGNLINSNRTTASALGASLDAPVLFMDFNQVPEGSIYNSSIATQAQKGIYVKDNSIFNNFGTRNDNYPWQGDGVINHSLRFNGINDYLYRNNATFGSAPTGNLTISAWVNLDSVTSGAMTVFEQSAPIGGGTSVVAITVMNGAVWFQTRPQLSAPVQTVASSTNLTVGTWNHLVGTINETGWLHLYVNGTETGTPVLLTNISGHTRMTMGVEASDSGGSTLKSYFKGKIDEVMLFNRSLTSIEISNLYRNQSIGLRYLDNDSNLRDYYALNGSSESIAQDDTNLNNMTLSGFLTTAPTYNSTGGYDGSGAYEFDGVDDYLSLTTVSHANNYANDFSYCAWINLHSSKQNPLFIYANGFASPWFNHILYVNSSNVLRFEIFNGANVYVIGSSISLNTWTYVCATIKKSENISLYVNGVKIVTTTSSSTVISPTYDKTYIGGSPYSAVYIFNGSIDNAQIFTRALSDSEILNMYNGTINNSNYNGKYSNPGSFDSPVFYNTTAQFWRLNFSIADTYSNRTGIVNADNSINLSNPNLVSYWKLDGDFVDAKGINNGTGVSGLSGLNNASGISSAAIRFDGSDDYINISRGFSTINGSNNHTLSFWFKANIFSNMPILLSNGAPGTYYFQLNSATSMYVQTGATFRTYTVNLATGQWYNLVFVKNGTGNNGTLYLNGVQQNTYSGTIGSTPTPVYDMLLGCYTPSVYSLNGQMDEVLIYNKSLSFLEINQLYKSGLSQKATTNITLQTRTASNYNLTDPSLVSFWNFNEDNTTDAFDSLGRNNLSVGLGALSNTSSGIVGNGTFFDGVDDATAGTFNQANQTNWTISGWLYPRTVAASTSYTFFENDVPGYGNDIKTGINSFSTCVSNRFCLVYDVASQSLTINDTMDVITNRWYLYTATYNSTHLSLYIDNRYVGSVACSSGSCYLKNTWFNIGRGTQSANKWWNGFIDEVRVYNRSLSYNEVLDLYNHGTTEFTDINAWSSPGLVSDGIEVNELRLGKFMQFRANLNSNTTDVSPYVLNYTIDGADGLAPNVTVSSPVNSSSMNNVNNFNMNFSANITDNIAGIKNLTLNIYNRTGLFNQTNMSFVQGTLTSTVGIVVTLVEGIYTWFWDIFDWNNNRMTLLNYTLGVGNLCSSGNLTSTCVLNSTYNFVDGEIIAGKNLIINVTGSITNTSLNVSGTNHGASLLINFSTITILSGGSIIGGNITIVTNNLTLYNGSKIDVSFLGYNNRAGPGVGGNGAGGYGAGGGGGSHGGVGGIGYASNLVGSPTTPGLVYDSSLYPTMFGSGGGYNLNYHGSPISYYGSAGGGIIALFISDNLEINGSLQSNGESPLSKQGHGGGSGGSILIITNNITGTGNITSLGGRGSNNQDTAWGAGGSGGRIAVYYNYSNFNFINVSVTGGLPTPGSYGASTTRANPGTAIAINKILNSVIIKEGFQFQGLTGIANETQALNQSFWNSANPFVWNFTNLTIYGMTNLTNPNLSLNILVNYLNVTNSSGFTFLYTGTNPNLIFNVTSTNLNENLTNINFNSYSYMVIQWPFAIRTLNNSAIQTYLTGNSTINIVNKFNETLDMINSVYGSITNQTIINLGTSDNIKNLNLMNGSFIYGGYINISVVNLTIDSSSSLYAYGLGYSANYGPGKAVTEQTAAWGANGASHGGYGSRSKFVIGRPIVYGSSLNPDTFGSGGSSGVASGGGIIKLAISDTFTLNGTVNSDAANIVQAFNGGASGGSIYADVNNLLGMGNFTARGSNAGIANNYDSGAGAGGRIAVYYNSSNFTGINASSVRPGVGTEVYGHAEDGTLIFINKLTNSAIIKGGFMFQGLTTPANETQSQNQSFWNSINPGVWNFTNLIVYGGALLTNVNNSINLSINYLNVTNSSGFNFTYSGTNSGLLLNVTSTNLNENITNIRFYSSKDLSLQFPFIIKILNNSNILTSFTGSIINVINQFNETLDMINSSYGSFGNQTIVNFGTQNNIQNLNLKNNSIIYGGYLNISLINLTIDYSSGLNARGLGYPAFYGPGKAVTEQTAGWGASGAGHGGYGSRSQFVIGRPIAYGSSLKPDTFGSGGASGSDSGGGVIKLSIRDTFFLNGTINSDAADIIGSYDGGAAGGSIYADLNNFLGVGNFTSDGSNAGVTNYNSGAGAGGRIAVYYNYSNFTGINASNVQPGVGTNVYGNADYGTLIFIDKLTNSATIKDGFKFQGLTSPANETQTSNQSFWNSANPSYYNFTNLTILSANVTNSSNIIILNVSNYLLIINSNINFTGINQSVNFSIFDRAFITNISNSQFVPNLNLEFVNSSAGKAMFSFANFNGSTFDPLVNQISINANNISLDENANPNLNRSARLTIINNNYGNKILRNGVECNSSTTPACYNLTSRIASSVIFNVTSFSEYSLGDNVYPNGSLNLPINNFYTRNTSQNLSATLSDDFGIRNVSLFINGVLNQTVNYAVGTVTTTIGITLTFVDGVYNWFYSLFDWAGNNFVTENRTLIIDTAYPKLNFTFPTPDSGDGRSEHFTINVTITEINFANVTLDWNGTRMDFNYTNESIINLGNGSYVFTYIQNGLVAGLNYTYQVNATDLANNMNSTEIRTILGNSAPTINGITQNVYDNASIDPGTVILITLNVTDKEENFDSAVFELRNSTFDLINSTIMTNPLSKIGTMLLNISLALPVNESTYYYRIITNDTIGATSYSLNYTLFDYWDCTWNAYTDNSIPTTMGLVTGFNINKRIRNITINNNGDYNYSLDHCRLKVSLFAGSLDSGFDYLIPSANLCGSKACVDANNSVTISVNYIFGQVISRFNYNMSATLYYSPSSARHSVQVLNGTIVTQQAGPYLTQEVAINDADGIIELTPQTLNFNAYIQNAMGDNSVNNSAYNVSSNWHIPSLEFTNLSEPLDYFYNNLSDDSQFLESLNLNFTDLENFNTTSAGKFYSFTLLSQGFQNVSANSENLTLINQSGTSLFNDTVKLFFKCYETSDGVKVWGCWPSDPDTVYCGNSRVDKTNGMNETCDDGNTISGDGCSSTCQIEPSTTTISSGGGGGGGGGSTGNEFIEQSNATFELLRGEKQEFSLEIRNKYSNPMSNVSVSVSGLNSEYISISPKVIDYIPGLGSRNVTVKINAPAYFNGKKYMLIFDISGKITINNTSYPIQNKKSVTLYILEVSRTDSILYLNESAKFLREMISFNMSTKEISILIEQEKKAFVAISFTELKAIHEKIKLIYTNAMGSKAIMDELSAGIIASEKQGITVSESKKLLYLGQIAFNRGDYALAIQRLQQAKLVYALEIKGEFNLFYTIKNKPLQSLGVILLLGFFGVGSTLLIRYRLYKNKLKILGEEELLLLELMKMIQRQCFEENRMSMEEYNSAMNQYENKLSETVADKIRIETKLANMFKLKGKKMALDNERKILLTLIMKIQDDYMNKKQMETRIYENMLKSYSGRLSEVDEQLAFLEAQDAVAHQVKSRGFFKK